MTSMKPVLRDRVFLAGDVIAWSIIISTLVAAADEGRTDKMRESLAGLFPRLGSDVSPTVSPPCTAVGGMRIAALERERAHAGINVR